MGGNSTKATSGINGAGTQPQQELGIPDSAKIFFEDTKRSVSPSTAPPCPRHLSLPFGFAASCIRAGDVLGARAGESGPSALRTDPALSGRASPGAAHPGRGLSGCATPTSVGLLPMHGHRSRHSAVCHLSAGPSCARLAVSSLGLGSLPYQPNVSTRCGFSSCAPFVRTNVHYKFRHARHPPEHRLRSGIDGPALGVPVRRAYGGTPTSFHLTSFRLRNPTLDLRLSHVRLY